MNVQNSGVIVVTPVYEDAEASSRLFLELAAEFHGQVYVEAIDDRSIRQPSEVASLENAGVDGVILKLRRNAGHQCATAIGLGYVAEQNLSDQCIVVMNSDGEDMPSTIPHLTKALSGHDVDVIVAHRKSLRVESIRFKAFYVIYKAFFGLMTGRSIRFGNFMALKVSVAERLVSMQELLIQVTGTVLASKMRTRSCTLDRRSR